MSCSCHRAGSFVAIKLQKRSNRSKFGQTRGSVAVRACQHNEGFAVEKNKRFQRGASVCALAGSAIFINPSALAQNANAAPTEEIDEVVVTGIRASQRSSLELKREAIQVV